MLFFDYAISLNQCLAKYREGVVAILASCMVCVSLAFFNAILQDLVQDAAFSFANKCKCVFNNVSLFYIVTVQAAFFCFSVGSIMCPSELDASSWSP